MIFGKKLLLLILCCLAVSAYGQKNKTNFSFGVDLFTDIWYGLPAGIETRTINQGVSIYGMYDTPFQNSGISAAIGLGLGVHNMYSNGMLEVNDEGYTEIIPFPEEAENGTRIGYKRNKLSLAYLDLPFAIRYRAPEGLRLSLGFKVGYNINAHTKYIGDDLEVGGKQVFIKTKNIENIEDFRYGPTFSIGYKWVNFIGYYSMSKVFKNNQGPAIYPFSIGISLRPF